MLFWTGYVEMWWMIANITVFLANLNSGISDLLKNFVCLIDGVEVDMNVYLGVEIG